MIEAQPSKREVLEQIKRQYPATIGYRIALLGDRAKDGVVFHQLENAPTASSILSDHAGTPARDLVCKMEVLDHVLVEEHLQRPELIKIDVQGYELEVLKGATETLAKAHAIMMEVSLIELYKGNPLLNEAIGFMHEKGFRPYDICTLNRRSLDNALVQADMIFLKNDSFLLAQKTWA